MKNHLFFAMIKSDKLLKSNITNVLLLQCQSAPAWKKSKEVQYTRPYPLKLFQIHYLQTMFG